MNVLPIILILILALFGIGYTIKSLFNKIEKMGLLNINNIVGAIGIPFLICGPGLFAFGIASVQPAVYPAWKATMIGSGAGMFVAGIVVFSIAGAHNFKSWEENEVDRKAAVEAKQKREDAAEQLAYDRTTAMEDKQYQKEVEEKEAKRKRKTATKSN